MLSKPGAPDTRAPEDVELSDRQIKEIIFNEKKLVVAKIEAYHPGHLTQDEIDGDPDILHATLDHMEKIAKNQKRRLQMKATGVKKAHTEATLLNGRAIFWAMTPPATSLESAHRHGANRVQERAHADIIVVGDPAAAAPRTIIAAGMTGAPLVTPEYVETNGVRGAAVAFTAAAESQRWVHISEKFMAENTGVCDDVIKVLEVPTNKWKFANRGELQGLLAKPRGAQMVMVFLTQEDLDNDEYNEQGLQHKIRLHDAMSHPCVCKLDQHRCRTGRSLTH